MVDNVYSDPVNRVVNEQVYFPKKIRKGKKWAISVPITKKLKWYLERYDCPTSGYLFPSFRNPGKPISYEAVYKYMKDAACKAGLGHQKVSTHSGRRSLVTHLLKAGSSLETIRQITGHRSLQNLQAYIEVGKDQVAAAIDNVAL